MDCIGYKVTTDAASEPVSAATMKTYLRLSGTTYDTLLEGLITSCRQYLERTTGRIFLGQTISVRYAGFPDFFLLPVTPVQSITSVKYDVSGTEYTLAAANYELQDHALFPRIVPAYDVSWPAADENSVIIVVSAGATTADKLGIAIVQAMVADLFEHPESNVEIALTENRTIERMMNAYRTGW